MKPLYEALFRNRVPVRGGKLKVSPPPPGASSAQRPWTLIGAAVVMTDCKELTHWVRFKVFLKECLLVDPDDPFLPGNAWANAGRF
jgi:hypothetical protein